MLTDLDKKRIRQYPHLRGKEKWETSRVVRTKAGEFVNDLVFLLESRESIGPLSGLVDRKKVQQLARLALADLGMEQSNLNPDLVISIIEENRVLSEIISKKNKVWRDLVAHVNSARKIEDYFNDVLEQNNVYVVKGRNVRVHLRRQNES